MTLDHVPAFTATTHANHLSKRYCQYSTAALVAPLLNESWKITTAFQVKPRVRNPEHAKHLVRVTHPSLNLGQERLELLLTNSHDGSSRFKLEIGAWRMVCSNGIICGTHFAAVDIQHTRAFEAVQEQAHRLIETAPEVAAVFDAWKSRQTTEDERRFLVTQAAALRWPINPPIDPASLLTIRRQEDYGNELWPVFNRVQENIMQGGLRPLKDRRTPRAVRSIDTTLHINRGLWQVAEQVYAGALVLPS